MGTFIIGFVYRPEGKLVISSCSFEEAICGQTRTGGKEERKPGCPGTDARLLHLHTSGCESLQGDGWHLEEHMNINTEPINMVELFYNLSD